MREESAAQQRRGPEAQAVLVEPAVQVAPVDLDSMESAQVEMRAGPAQQAEQVARAATRQEARPGTAAPAVLRDLPASVEQAESEATAALAAQAPMAATAAQAAMRRLGRTAMAATVATRRTAARAVLAAQEIL